MGGSVPTSPAKPYSTCSATLSVPKVLAASSAAAAVALACAAEVARAAVVPATLAAMITPFTDKLMLLLATWNGLATDPAARFQVVAPSTVNGPL